jgi:hypothetical protein
MTPPWAPTKASNASALDAPLLLRITTERTLSLEEIINMGACYVMIFFNILE